MFGRYMNRAGRFVRTNVDARRTRFNFSNPLARENIPFYGAIIGITAFTFQITVLHPWHDQLSEQFIDIEKLIKKLDESSKHLDEKMEKVMMMEKSVKANERQILSHGQDILKMETTVLRKLDELAMGLMIDNAQLEAQISRLENEIIVENSASNYLHDDEN